MSGTGNTVKNSYIYGSWFNGILAGGSGHLIENNTIEQTDWMGMRSATIMPYGDLFTFATIRSTTRAATASTAATRASTFHPPNT